MDRIVRAPLIDDYTESDIQRMERVKNAIMILSYNIWFEYPRALEILDQFLVKYLEAYNYYENPITNIDVRPTSLFLSGDINTGKTTIVIKFISYCKGEAKRLGRKFSKYDILFYETPVRVTFKRMFSSILEKFGTIIRGSALHNIHTDALIDMIIEELRNKKVKLLFFDEIQNLIKASGEDKEDIFAGFKKLTNESQTRIILVGTPTSAELLADSRFVDERIKVLELPAWDITETEGMKEWADLLFSIYQAYKDFLPNWDLVIYDKEVGGNIVNPEIAEYLHLISGERLGKLLKTIKDAIVYALLHNKSNLDKKDYEAVQMFSYEINKGNIIINEK